MTNLYEPSLNTDSPKTISEKEIFLMAASKVLDRYLDGKIQPEETVKKIIETFETLTLAANNFTSE